MVEAEWLFAGRGLQLLALFTTAATVRLYKALARESLDWLAYSKNHTTYHIKLHAVAYLATYSLCPAIQEMSTNGDFKIFNVTTILSETTFFGITE